MKLSFRTWREPLAVLGVFIALAGALTWPLCDNLPDHVPGDNGDAFALLWNFWYLPYALTVPGVSPCFTNLQLAPYGADLIFHTNCFLPAFAAWPVYASLGLAAACDLAVLFAIALTGWGTYLFAREVGVSLLSAALAGYAFAFCPFVFAHLPGHYTLVQTQFIPFALLFLRRCTRATTPAWLDAIGLGITIWGAAVTDFTILVITLLLSIVCLAGVMFDRRHTLNWRAALINLLSAAVLAVILAIPWIRSYHLARLAHDYSTRLPWAGSEYVCRLRDFLVPPVFHGMWGHALNPKSGTLPWNYSESGGYLGWVCLLCAATAVFLCREWRVWVWGFAFLVFANLSLGNRYSAAAHGHLRWLMLGRWLPQLPLLDQIRVPARFSLGAHFCLAVLLAFGADALSRARWRLSILRDWRWVWPVAIAPLLALDFWFVPLPLAVVAKPPAYCSFLAKQNGAALIFPIGVGSGNGYNAGKLRAQQLIDQSVHHRPLISGYISRIPNDVADHMRSDVVFNALLALQNEKQPALEPTPEQITQFVRGSDIRWIVIGAEYTPDSPLRHFLKQWPIGVPQVFDGWQVFALELKS